MTWSIAVEFQFYFVLPVVVAIWLLLCRRRLLPCVLAVGVAILVCYLLWPPEEASGNDVRLGPYMAVFLCGSLLAMLHYYWRHSPWVNHRRWQWGLEMVGIGAILLALTSIPALYNWLFSASVHRSHFHQAFIPYALIWGMLLFAVLNGRGYLRAALQWQPLRVMGFISFSAYLVHPTCVGVISALNRMFTMPGWLQVAGVLLITVLISLLSFYLIEAPSSRIRLRAPQQTATAT